MPTTYWAHRFIIICLSAVFVKLKQITYFCFILKNIVLVLIFLKAQNHAIMFKIIFYEEINFMINMLILIIKTIKPVFWTETKKTYVIYEFKLKM